MMQPIGTPEWITMLLTVLSVLVMLAAPVLVIGLGVWLGLSFARRNSRPVEAATPLDVLRMRYAKGELTKEQFESMKRDITART